MTITKAARRDVRPALAIAQATGDETLELEAKLLHAQVEGEAGDNDPTPWVELARVAGERGRFDLVAEALRVRAAFDWDDDPAASLPVIEEAAEVARVHGLVEGTGWATYGRTEANLSLGDWDAAIATGLDAIAYAEARDLHRVVVRTVVRAASDRGRAWSRRPARAGVPAVRRAPGHGA